MYHNILIAHNRIMFESEGRLAAKHYKKQHRKSETMVSKVITSLAHEKLSSNT